MEDMARLAVVEQSIGDVDKFNKILYQLLRHMTHILNNPHDYDMRTLKTDILEDVLQHEAFSDYLKYVGYRPEGCNLVYDKKLPLSKLRMAQAAIERKINFCYGVQPSRLILKPSARQGKKVVLQPTNILTTKNPFLQSIQNLFNRVLEYEDEDLQVLAREQIPIVTLQLMALDRVREQQKRIKSGETKELDLPFDVALLMELLSWFKYKFFSWVDQPPCDICGGPTVLRNTVTATSEQETCRMEMYSCGPCGPRGGSRFPRYNRSRTLLRTRRGRCGEWANCFALLCRALGYDTRYVYDTTDHVWCEVFDNDSKTWLHADPCEAKLNTPLMYEHGWDKKLSYVIAVSRDDIQDVTWRYTLNHKQTLLRRNSCSEQELLDSLLSLREHRQRHLSEARRKYLAKRTLHELVLLMQEKKPTDYESHGRISGSIQWRSERGEVGKGHTFVFTRPGNCAVGYNSGADKYSVSEEGLEDISINGWAAGVYQAENIFRKVEYDWKQAYLAREEGQSSGSVAWRFMAKDGLHLTDITMRISTAIYENGSIQWTIQYDSNEPEPLTFDENGRVSLSACACAVVRARLGGGRGAVAWQHAQLCRAPLDQPRAALQLRATCV
ncbi:unnamed protein product [Arctia plantaginis]|uniref:Peptide-N(4)-(N-acetyl-beta-glucosaminyl)asparagine amidase n=1 Tax=Arctia plantaginis TaxID=874455 RepID=A0A8S1BCK9_ARCPL|nr:unnamed protein product [Arctia plantaginis]